jgi:hypothetical protein
MIRHLIDEESSIFFFLSREQFFKLNRLIKIENVKITETTWINKPILAKNEKLKNYYKNDENQLNISKNLKDSTSKKELLFKIIEGYEKSLNGDTIILFDEVNKEIIFNEVLRKIFIHTSLGNIKPEVAQYILISLKNNKINFDKNLEETKKLSKEYNDKIKKDLES